LGPSEGMATASTIGAVIRKGCEFVEGEETQLPVELEVVFSFRQKRDAPAWPGWTVTWTSWQILWGT